MPIKLYVPEDTFIGKINLETEEVFPNDDNPISFQCNITGDCCDRLDIELNELDISRIVKAGYEVDQFLQSLSPIITKEGKGVLKYYMMKKREFDKRCIFLDDDNRCTIHEIKPFSCKLFPLEAEDDEEDEILVYIHIHGSNLCTGISNHTAQNRELLEMALHAYRTNDWDYDDEEDTDIPT